MKLGPGTWWSWRARATRRSSTSQRARCTSTTRASSRNFWESFKGEDDLQDGAKSEVLRRLKSVEGHVRGVAKMVEDEDVTYADVVQQTNAIFSAIRRINAVLLKDFVEERVAEEGASEEMVKDLVKAIDRVVK